MIATYPDIPSTNRNVYVEVIGETLMRFSRSSLKLVGEGNLFGNGHFALCKPNGEDMKRKLVQEIQNSDLYSVSNKNLKAIKKLLKVTSKRSGKTS